jgi:hypothetical protein
MGKRRIYNVIDPRWESLSDTGKRDYLHNIEESVYLTDHQIKYWQTRISRHDVLLQRAEDAARLAVHDLKTVKREFKLAPSRIDRLCVRKTTLQQEKHKLRNIPRLNKMKVLQDKIDKLQKELENGVL